MPRNLKRRSDAISRDDEVEESAAAAAATAGPSRRPDRHDRRSSSVSSVEQQSDSNSDNEAETQASTQGANVENLAKKLVRLALSSEYSRTPLRRTDIVQKIFREGNASPRLFKTVFSAAQTQLNHVFGMDLVQLPSRDKTSLKDRRTQATQPSKSQTSSAAWILVSTLGQAYKTHPTIITPTPAPSPDVEASYTALYTFILSLIYLNNSALTEAKMERYLKRVNADTYTPHGTLEKLLQRMVKDGYIEKKRDTTTGEEVVEYVPGPRGKVEVGAHGVAGLVRSAYGFGSVGLDGKYAGFKGNQQTTNDGDGGQQPEDVDDNGNEQDIRARVKIDRDELEQRLNRSLGTIQKQNSTSNQPTATTNGDGGTHSEEQNGPTRTRRTRRRANDDDDDDEDYH